MIRDNKPHSNWKMLMYDFLWIWLIVSILIINYYPWPNTSLKIIYSGLLPLPSMLAMFSFLFWGRIVYYIVLVVDIIKKLTNLYSGRKKT
jgi:hypothetical protein